MIGTPTRIVHLQDNGQDFLEWHLDDAGTVVDCQPFQGWLWCGSRVTNLAELAPGVQIRFIPARPNAPEILLRHLVQRVETVPCPN